MGAREQSDKGGREVFVLKGALRRPNEPRLRPSNNHIYFDAVVRHGSIRKAAETLHIASSALNRRILDLEEEVGAALFERLPRGVRLTAAGEMLLNYVRWSLKELRKVEAQIDQLRGEMRGVVRIAAAESVTPRLLPRAIDRYQAEHPGVAFHVMVAGPDALLDTLVRDEADLILTHHVPPGAPVAVLAHAAHPLCAFVARTHSLSGRVAIELGDCAAYPLAMPDHSLAARAVLELAMDEASLTLRPALESDSVETLKAFAGIGQAICFSFRLGQQDESQELVALELLDARCRDANLYLAARRGRVLPVAAASFVEQLKDFMHESLAGSSVSVA